MWLTAIILGFAGSLHCVGMCAPLVMAVTSFNKKIVVNKLVYNGGRIVTYALLGGAVSMLGAIIDLSGFQFVLTLMVAVTLILMGFSGISSTHIPILTPALAKFTLWIKTSFGELLRKRTITTMWFTGMLNGLLPCGLTYLALTYCLTLAGPSDGFQFMVLFGAGTLPAMVGFTGALGLLVRRFNVNLSLVSRYSFILMGGVVLVRLLLFNQHDAVTEFPDPAGIIFCR